MTRAEAVEVLQDYQRWRRDEDAGDDAPQVSMPDPKLIGQAIDVAIKVLAR